MLWLELLKPGSLMPMSACSCGLARPVNSPCSPDLTFPLAAIWDGDARKAWTRDLVMGEGQSLGVVDCTFVKTRDASRIRDHR